MTSRRIVPRSSRPDGNNRRRWVAGMVAVLLASAFPPLVRGGESGRQDGAGAYTVSDITTTLTEYQASLRRAGASDPLCGRVLTLNETHSDGEHAVFGVVAMRPQVRLAVRVRARNRYALQLGFASQGWNAYALATVSLISGAYRKIDAGTLAVTDVDIRTTQSDWLEAEIGAASTAPTADAGSTPAARRAMSSSS